MTQNAANKNKKTSPARSLKYVADTCLLCGSTAEAAYYYRAAFEGARASSDWLHAAGALEGLSCCAFLTDVRT